MAKRVNTPKAADALAEGLIDFYSSQAKLMLAQYENINQLLGPTKDWTHPGNHCEILLRDFLRRHLLQWMSVDKGYIYGGVSRSGRSLHSPEVDVLIHNVKDYSPVFRLDDFVIVQPEAVIGIIQVKRTFRKVAKNDTLAKGLKQVVAAKQHLLDVLIQKKAKNSVPLNVGDLVIPLFSAVVAFESSNDGSLQDSISAIHQEHKAAGHYDGTAIKDEISLYLLPTFIGSLKGLCAYARRNVERQTYRIYDSQHDDQNLSLQLFLHNMMSELKPLLDRKPFAFPNIACHPASFVVPPE